MNRRLWHLLLVAATAAWLPWRAATADTFGGGANAFDIELVTIGHPGNPPDTTGSPNPAGSVPYAYRIGKFEISREMIDKANATGALGITLADMTPYGGNGPHRPATGISWFEAAQFVNWLNTSTGNQPAYKFDGSGDFHLWAPSDPGYDAANLFRNSLAKYFLPSADEWYKAAYYDPAAAIYWDFPTGSNALPVKVASGTVAGTAVVQQGVEAGPADDTQAGGLSAYGTMAQGGNVGEWEETALDLLSNDPLERRGGRGGGWDSFPSSLSATLRAGGFPELSGFGNGFRVVSVIPEPNAAGLLAFASLAMLGMARTSRLTGRRKGGPLAALGRKSPRFVLKMGHARSPSSKSPAYCA